MLKRGLPPVHPGEILKELFIEPLGLTQAEFAQNLGITRKTLSMLLNEHQGVSAEMALRLSKAFNTSPDLWLNLQREFDLWHAEKKVKLSGIKPYRRTKSTPTEAAVLKRTA
jgi:antitoxin HigA-1